MLMLHVWVSNLDWSVDERFTLFLDFKAFFLSDRHQVNLRRC